MGEKDFTDSLIIIDEITLVFDSRNFKNFEEKYKKFFTLHRHDNSDIIYATQYYQNVDKRIKDVTAFTYYIKKMWFLSVAFDCPLKVLFPEETGEILFGWSPPKFLTKKEYCLRALYYKKFDSFERDNNRSAPVRNVWGIHS